MTQRQLNDFALSRGLVCMGSTLVGAWDGWPFLATLRFGRREVLQARFRYARGPAAAQVRRAELPAGCRLSLRRGELRLTCCAGGEDLLVLFREGMDVASGLLREGAAVLPGACALCGEEEWDSFALVGNRYVPVHRECCESRRRRVEAGAALNGGGGSYLTGWLGALAGGMAGLLPTVLTAWFWDMVSVWLCLCIPLGAYFGYKLCRGRMDRMAVAATVASSLVQVLLLDQVRYYQGFVNQGILPWVFASAAHYFKTLTLEEILLRVVDPLQFVTLGDVCALCIIDVINWDKTLSTDVMLDSLTERESEPAAWEAPAVGAAAPKEAAAAAVASAGEGPPSARTDGQPAWSVQPPAPEEPAAAEPAQWEAGAAPEGTAPSDGAAQTGTS